MESIYYEKLNTRDLWIDGESSANVNGICDKILRGELNFLDTNIISEGTKKEIKRFVSLADIQIPNTVKVKTKPETPDASFTIPEKYLSLDIQKRVIRGFKARHDIKVMDSDEKDDRLLRIADELERYNSMGLKDVLKCVIYIIDTFKAENVVWGPGRGSACCSYLLYLLEVHDIDSYQFDLDVNEFLR